MAGQHRGFLIIYMTALTALGSVSMSTYLPSMESIATALNATASQTQTTLATYLAGYAIGNFIHGPISDRFGRKPTMMGSLLLYVVASIVSIYATAIDQLIVTRLLQGVAATAGPVLGRAVLRDSFDGRELRRAYSVLTLAVGAAPAIGPIIGGFLQTWFGWQACFVFMATFGAVLGIIGLPFVRETNHNRDRLATRPGYIVKTCITLMRNRIFAGFALSYAFTNAVWFAYMAVSPFLFINELGLTPKIFGFVSIVPVFGFITGSFLVRMFGDRMSVRTLVLVGFALYVGASISLLLFSSSASLLGILIPMYFYMCGNGLLMSVHMAAALQPFPQFAGTASALFGFLQAAVGAIGNVIAALVYAHRMTEPALVIIFLVGIAIASLAITRPWNPMPASKQP